MSETLARKVRIGYGIFLSVFTAVLAVLFIVGVAQIYFADVPLGQPKYSREIVGEHLKPILIVMLVWILAIVGGYILSIVLPEAQRRKRAPSASDSLKKLKKRIPQGSSEEFLAEKKVYDRMQVIKIVIWSVCAAFALVSAIVSIVYLATGNHFDTSTGKNFNQLVVPMVRFIGPWVLISFLLFIGATLYEYFTAKKELAVAKHLLVLGKGSPVAARNALLLKKDAALKAVGRPKVIHALRIAVLAIAICFIVVGNLPINEGQSWLEIEDWFPGYREVLSKAADICTECIGLG